MMMQQRIKTTISYNSSKNEYKTRKSILSNLVEKRHLELLKAHSGLYIAC